MTAISVGTTATIITAPKQAARFIDIENNSIQIVYVSYDGTTPTTANGYPIPANGSLQLSGVERCSKGVQGIVAAGTADVRVQAG